MIVFKDFSYFGAINVPEKWMKKVSDMSTLFGNWKQGQSLLILQVYLSFTLTDMSNPVKCRVFSCSNYYPM